MTYLLQVWSTFLKGDSVPGWLSEARQTSANYHIMQQVPNGPISGASSISRGNMGEAHVIPRLEIVEESGNTSILYVWPYVNFCPLRCSESNRKSRLIIEKSYLKNCKKRTWKNRTSNCHDIKQYFDCFNTTVHYTSHCSRVTKLINVSE